MLKSIFISHHFDESGMELAEVGSRLAKQGEKTIYIVSNNSEPFDQLGINAKIFSSAADLLRNI